MTPKEKAIELINKMYKVHSNSASEITFYFATQCALIAWKEIIQEVNQNYTSNRYAYWHEVKKEIEKL
jgi:hypothetical protein